MNLCGWMRGFLQREEKPHRTKVKNHILLIWPCITVVSFKKNGGKTFSPKEGEILSSQMLEILKIVWKPMIPAEQQV